MKLALDKEQLIKRLESSGYVVDEVLRLANDKGWQVRLSTGQIVNRFDTGTVNVQGTNPLRRSQLNSAISFVTL